MAPAGAAWRGELPPALPPAGERRHGRPSMLAGQRRAHPEGAQEGDGRRRRAHSPPRRNLLTGGHPPAPPSSRPSSLLSSVNIDAQSPERDEAFAHIM